MQKLACIVSYSSLERMFLDDLVEQAALFSDALILCVGERLYSGAPEPGVVGIDLPPCARVITYAVRDHELATPRILHDRARAEGFAAAREALGTGNFWALFLDSDEVPDGLAFSRWWSARRDMMFPHASYKMLNAWAFFHPELRALQHEDSVILVHASRLDAGAIARASSSGGGRHVERDAIVRSSRLLLRRVTSDDARPMFTHFSWVRETKAQLLAKVASWGHKDDAGRDWAALVEGAYRRWAADAELPAFDFVHGHSLTRAAGAAPRRVVERWTAAQLIEGLD
jgi:hypothetical protein